MKYILTYDKLNENIEDGENVIYVYKLYDKYDIVKAKGILDRLLYKKSINIHVCDKTVLKNIEVASVLISLQQDQPIRLALRSTKGKIFNIYGCDKLEILSNLTESEKKLIDSLKPKKIITLEDPYGEEDWN